MGGTYPTSNGAALCLASTRTHFLCINALYSYEYRSADLLLRDFDLMKNNAIKFNGQANPISQEAIAIYDFVKNKIETNRDELSALEAAVDEQMNGKPKKKKAKTSLSSATTAGNVANWDGVPINLGDLKQSNYLGGDDSDSGDESVSGLLNL